MGGDGIIAKKVGGYLRLSDEDRFKLKDTDESESIQNQRDLFLEFVANHDGWEVYDIYVDENVSGTSTSRPEFERLLKDCESGNIDIVICKSQSRFTRTMEEVESIMHNKFEEWGVRFIGIVDHADTDNKGNKKQRQINGLTNEWYLEDGSENIRSALKIKRKNGKFTGSFAPYGYLIDPNDKNHLIPDPIAKEVVREIFQKYIEGYGYQKIRDHLNDNGISSPSERKKEIGSNFVCGHAKNRKTYWNNDTVAKILRNEMYLGKLLQGKTTRVSYKNKKIKKLPRDKWIIVENTHEPIIELELWKNVEAKIKKHHKVTKTGKIQIFSKKVYCGCCGKSYTKNVCNTSKGKIDYLRCGSVRLGGINCNNKSIRMDDLKKVVLEAFKEKQTEFLDESRLKVNVKCEFDKNSFYQRLKALKQEKEKIVSSVKNSNYYLKGLYEDKRDNIITQEDFLILRNEYDVEVKNYELRIIQIDDEIEILEHKQEKNDDLEGLLEKYKNIKRLTREMIELFIYQIRIGEKDKDTGMREIEIEWDLF